MDHSHEIRIACEILYSFKRLGKDGIPLEFMAIKQYGTHCTLCRATGSGRVVFLKTHKDFKEADRYMIRMAETHKQLGD